MSPTASDNAASPERGPLVEALERTRAQAAGKSASLDAINAYLRADSDLRDYDTRQDPR